MKNVLALVTCSMFLASCGAAPIVLQAPEPSKQERIFVACYVPEHSAWSTDNSRQLFVNPACSEGYIGSILKITDEAATTIIPRCCPAPAGSQPSQLRPLVPAPPPTVGGAVTPPAPAAPTTAPAAPPAAATPAPAPTPASTKKKAAVPPAGPIHGTPDLTPAEQQ